MNNDKPGLYIHVPFCKSKCGYCSFYSIASPDLIPAFVKAVVREMAFYKSPLSFPRRRESSFFNGSLDSRLRTLKGTSGNDVEEYPFTGFDTIYIGGGTPSLLAVRDIETILRAITNHFEIDHHAEITMEVNPGDVSLNYFQDLRRSGINRLNIGIQSFDDDILKFLGRRHTATEAKAAIVAARKAGFDNVGMDLIYGVHGQNLKDWKQTLQQALIFSPEHLSCYQLSLDSNTPLFRHYKQEGLRLPEENEAFDFFMTTSQTLTEAGYIHYEVSNFSRTQALTSRHNTKYWRHTPYLGMGPSAHSFWNNKRWWNKADVDSYIKDMTEGKTPVEQYEELSVEQLALEALFLGLRTKDGIDLDACNALFGIDILLDKKKTIDELIENKLVELKDGRLRPTLTGMAVADSLALI